MSAAPLAAVVVPVYNAGPYLSACLRSLAAQTLPDWRCYLVDDGSDDGSRPRCATRRARGCALYGAAPGAVRRFGRAGGRGRAAKADGAALDRFLRCGRHLPPRPAARADRRGAGRRHAGGLLPVRQLYREAPHDAPARPAPRACWPRRAIWKRCCTTTRWISACATSCTAPTCWNQADFDNGFSFNEDLLTNWIVVFRACRAARSSISPATTTASTRARPATARSRPKAWTTSGGRPSISASTPRPTCSARPTRSIMKSSSIWPA